MDEIKYENIEDMDGRMEYLESQLTAAAEREMVLREALEAIAEGCSFPENEVQKAVVTRARAALAAKENT